MAKPFDRFSRKTQQIVFTLAQYEAKKLGHSVVGSEHLLLAILSDSDNMAKRALNALDVDYTKVKELIEDIIDTKEEDETPYMLSYSTTTRNSFNLALYEAGLLRSEFIEPEHLLLGIMRMTDSVAFKILLNLGVSAEYTRSMIVNIIKDKSTSDNDKKKKPSPVEENNNSRQNKKQGILEKYSRDLTELARNNLLDPVIGREKEVERVIQILSRRTKNNPCLIGEPGVGKTAVAEGLAIKISQGDVPETIINKKIVSLDLSLMIAGTKYRGEFEERLTEAISEIQNEKNIILFIDEIHNIVGAGAAEGAIDAADILKPALARGDVQAIGATTTDEYRKYIEKDAALERRFQPVIVEEPSIEESIDILKGLRSQYEQHHKLKITDEAIVAAVELSAKYISDRFLPDKAIDLIDEAGAMIRLKFLSESDEIVKIENQLDMCEQAKVTAIKEQDFEKAARIRDQQNTLRETLFKQRELASVIGRNKTEAIVSEDDIAIIISDWTKIPVTKLTETESERLLNLENLLSRRVVGQSEAIKAVSKAIRRSRVGLKDPKKPIGTFIFLGPTGVGKTELSKALAEAVFGKEEAIIRIDMSEYMEKHTVAKLIGSPPGYIGYDDAGQLTEKVRRNPYSVILFDELEKAHPDVINILLQILDDGRLTDSHGKVVDFKNSLIIMTSNVGADRIKKQHTLGFGSEDNYDDEYLKMKDLLEEELKKRFKPEFINRLDDVIVFRKLNENDIYQIIDILLREFTNRLSSLEITLNFTDALKKHIAEVGTDLEYGARPLKRTIQKVIEDNMSEEILKGNIKPNSSVTIDFIDEKIVFNNTDILNLDKIGV